MMYLLLVSGFVFLIVGAILLVNGASAIASRFGVSNLVIGITVVGFCTSVPELYTVLYADFEGAKNMAVDIVLGSNIFNILFILGISAIICPLMVRKSTGWKEVPMTKYAVKRREGMIFLILYLGYIAYIACIS
jgi:cation:H+ antiporter